MMLRRVLHLSCDCAFLPPPLLSPSHFRICNPIPFNSPLPQQFPSPSLPPFLILRPLHLQSRQFRSNSPRAMRNANGKVVSKSNLPSKVCLYCGRPFTWRKKWERCWDEVLCCSKKCRAGLKQRRRTEGGGKEGIMDGISEDDQGRREKGGESRMSVTSGLQRSVEMGEGIESEEDNVESPENDVDEWKSRPVRRRRGESSEERKARKALTKAKKASNASDEDTIGQKNCDLCGKPCDVLIRCAIDEKGDWKMICTGGCWKAVSGDKVDGDEKTNKYYRYGGMWKNHHKEGVTAKMPRAVKERLKKQKQMAEA